MNALTAYRVARRLEVDGRLSDSAWAKAQKSWRFVDMATGKPAIYDTRAAALWDDQFLYVGFWIEEPYPRARLTDRDSLIFQENDVEVFIDGGDCYYEFEINALGTVYEVFFIWRDAYDKGLFREPEFELAKALTFGGDHDRKPMSFWEGIHPRGLRLAYRHFDFPGLESAVHVNGSLNDDSRPSEGWTAMVRFPWSGMGRLANGRTVPPNDGDVWRLFFGRFEVFDIGGSEVRAAWCLSPHGVYDTHFPDKFTPVTFSSKLIDDMDV